MVEFTRLCPPTAFISYSWDSTPHKAWVALFGERLREDGVDLGLDEWHLHPGDQLPHFMETAIRTSDFVLIICTPQYKQRSNTRSGGVGYEGNIITAEIYAHGSERKFIPILRNGQWGDAAPSWLLGKNYIDLRGEPYAEEAYYELLSTLHGIRPAPPPVGEAPASSSQTRLSPKAATRQRAYTEFVAEALAAVRACNQRYVLQRHKGPVAALLGQDIEAEIKKRSNHLQALLQEISLLSSESVTKAAYEMYGLVFLGEVTSMRLDLEPRFKEAHSKLVSEALPKFRQAVREEAQLR